VPPGLDGANLTQGTVRMRPSWVINGEFLSRYLAGPSAQAWMKARYFGNAMPRINVEDAREIPIPIPPVAEQSEITRQLGLRLERLERGVCEGVRSACDHWANLDRAILSKAFRGELVPQDPNDEPVAVVATPRGRGHQASARRDGCPERTARSRRG
jgi:type I restriction enzyme S subunit